jgi:hypothetical protein
MKKWTRVALLGPLFFLTLMLVPNQSSRAESDVYEVVVKKQEKKKSSRWTLQEWLATKERIRWMDLWLALHSSVNPFEFYLGATRGQTEYSNDSNPGLEDFDSLQFHGAAYASITGLEAYMDQESGDDKRKGGQFNLRVFGNAHQSTHLNLFYGYEQWTIQSNDYERPYWGGQLQLYLTQFFGIRGNYRKFNEDESASGSFIEGNKLKLGAFIDFAFFQVFGEWEQSEHKTWTASDLTRSPLERETLSIGARLFF